MTWVSVAAGIPSGEMLIYREGHFCVAVYVRNAADAADPGVFMDARSSDILPWPSHWMALPDPPEPLSDVQAAPPPVPPDDLG